MLSGNGSGCTREDIINNCRPPGEDCDWNIALQSQSDVNAFPSLYHCLRVTGTLTIAGNDITNLDSLYKLTRVGRFTIRNNASLTNITGLRSLRRVDGDLQITANARLASLDGLSNLTFVKGSLGIGNASLTDLEGLSALDSVGNLNITGNPALTSLNGLRSLAFVSGGLEISGNPALTDLEGLGGVTELGRFTTGVYLTIANNRSLTNIDGLRAISFVNHGIIIADNPALKNLNGFSALTSIGGGQYGSLEIARNSSLTDMDGLSSLTRISGDSYLSLNGNVSLLRCCGLYGLLQNNGVRTIAISGNGAGCTRDEIIAGGLCPHRCPQDGPRPLDKYVFAEYDKGYAPHSTNIIVRDYEPGILYELRKAADHSPVAGPFPGMIGLYAHNIMETTTYSVLARNPDTNCENVMKTQPVVTIIPIPSDTVDCAFLPIRDTEIRAERDSIPPGTATNIIVLDGQGGVEYMLRNNENDAPVFGPVPATEGLYTGELYHTTTFNVLAIDLKTRCSREMSMNVTVTMANDKNLAATGNPNPRITENAEANDQPILLYPNPGNGEFDLEVVDDFLGLYYLNVSDISGSVIKKQTVLKEGKTLKVKIDLKPLSQGVYMLSIHRANGIVGNRKLVITD
jgi:hypothetical protein